MRALLELFRDLCLLRRGPQDLPYSPGLLLIALALDLMLASRAASVNEAAAPLALSLLFALSLPWLALRLAHLPERYLQTATALLGCRIAFTLLAVPVVLGIGEIPTDPKTMTGTQLGLGWLALLLLGWQLAVRGNILRHSLNLPMRLGVLVGVVFMAVEVVFELALFGRNH
jgi:hypothetical protein